MAKKIEFEMTGKNVGILSARLILALLVLALAVGFWIWGKAEYGNKLGIAAVLFAVWSGINALVDSSKAGTPKGKGGRWLKLIKTADGTEADDTVYGSAKTGGTAAATGFEWKEVTDGQEFPKGTTQPGPTEIYWFGFVVERFVEVAIAGTVVWFFLSIWPNCKGELTDLQKKLSDASEQVKATNDKLGEAVKAKDDAEKKAKEEADKAKSKPTPTSDAIPAFTNDLFDLIERVDETTLKFTPKSGLQWLMLVGDKPVIVEAGQPNVTEDSGKLVFKGDLKGAKVYFMRSDSSKPSLSRDVPPVKK